MRSGVLGCARICSLALVASTQVIFLSPTLGHCPLCWRIQFYFSKCFTELPIPTCLLMHIPWSYQYADVQFIVAAPNQCEASGAPSYVNPRPIKSFQDVRE